MDRRLCAAGNVALLTRRHGDAEAQRGRKMIMMCFCRTKRSQVASNFLYVSSSLRLCVCLLALNAISSFFGSRVAAADVTAEQVNAAINSGVAFLEKQQRPDG